jgi:hypothetical protein
MKKLLALFLILLTLAGVAKASSFTDIFSGSAVNPSAVAYAAYSFGSNLTLAWPTFPGAQTSTAARFMNLTATTTGLDVYMPDATLQSVGYDVIISNPGTNTFNVVSYNGDAIATIPAGQTWYILETGNTMQDGTWYVLQFGTGTSQAQASQLAGYGLLAIASTLNLNLDSNPISTNTTLTTANRAQLQVWTGGTGTISLPSAASAGEGFFFAVANNGSGTLTIQPNGSDQIDGGASSIYQPTQSAFIIDSGTAWYSVGKGIQNTFAVTLLNLNVAGSSNVTETSAQAQNIIQQFTGALTGNIAVIVPATVQLYFVYNDTTGPYTLTVRTPSGTGIQVGQGQNVILYCDGTNIVNGFSYVVSSSVILATGSATSPPLAWQGNLNTGLYSPGTNISAFSSAGKESGQFMGSSSAVNYWELIGSATGLPVELAAAGSDTNVSLELVPQGTGNIDINGPLNFTTTASAPQNGVYLSMPNTLSLGTAGVGAITIGSNQGVVVGSPTGGNEGSGTINSQALYVNGNIVAVGAGVPLGSSTTASPYITGSVNSGLYATSTNEIDSEIAGSHITSITTAGFNLVSGSYYLGGYKILSYGLNGDDTAQALGLGALAFQSSATLYNTALGADALEYLTNGQFNAGVGDYAGSNVLTGRDETALGYGALGAQTGNLTGYYNTAVGSAALLNTATAAASNTALGYSAGSSITTGASNVVIGPAVGSTTLTTGSNNVLIGTTSGVDTTSSSSSNTINIQNIYEVTGTGTASTSNSTIEGNLAIIGTTTGAAFNGTSLAISGTTTTASLDVTGTALASTVTAATINAGTFNGVNANLSGTTTANNVNITGTCLGCGAPVYNHSGSVVVSPHVVSDSGTCSANAFTLTLTGSALYSTSTSWNCSCTYPSAGSDACTLAVTTSSSATAGYVSSGGGSSSQCPSGSSPISYTCVGF